MCFNVSLVQSAEIMAVEFNAAIDDNLIKPIYFASAFSLPQWPVLKDEAPEHFSCLKWGLIPWWIKNYDSARDIRFKTLNARVESIHEKASFKKPSDHNRCLIPIDGWYEWKEIKGKKYPHYIYQSNRKPFLLAGLWDKWVNLENKKNYETFTVITTRALGICAQIHNRKERMPFIIDNNLKDLWLNRDLKYNDIKNKFEPQWSSLKAHGVSDLISSKKKERNVAEARSEVSSFPVQMEFF